MSTSETKVLTAHVPLPMAEKLDQLAERLERSRGWIIKQALADWIAHEERRRQLTMEAMADVDAGRLVDQEDMEAWASRLDSGDPGSVPA